MHKLYFTSVVGRDFFQHCHFPIQVVVGAETQKDSSLIITDASLKMDGFFQNQRCQNFKQKSQQEWLQRLGTFRSWAQNVANWGQEQLYATKSGWDWWFGTLKFPSTKPCYQTRQYIVHFIGFIINLTESVKILRSFTRSWGTSHEACIEDFQQSRVHFFGSIRLTQQPMANLKKKTFWIL